jgi:hypothetical protein
MNAGHLIRAAFHGFTPQIRSNFISSASTLARSSSVMTSIWALDGGVASKAVQWLLLTVWQAARIVTTTARNVTCRAKDVTLLVMENPGKGVFLRRVVTCHDKRRDIGPSHL